MADRLVFGVARDEVKAPTAELQVGLLATLRGGLAYRANDDIIKELAALAAEVNVRWNLVRSGFAPASFHSPSLTEADPVNIERVLIKRQLFGHERRGRRRRIE